MTAREYMNTEPEFTYDEFIAFICDARGWTKDELLAKRVPLRCSCREGSCRGWALIINDPDLIKDHIDMYWPKDEPGERGKG